MRIEASEAILAVRDVVEAVRFYVDVLGFGGEWLWGEPPTFGGVRAPAGDGGPGAHIMFNRMPDVAARVDGHQHWVRVDDPDGFYEKHKSAGAEIVDEIADRPWGMREYVVRDPNGYRLRFAGPSDYRRPATGADALPPHIEIQRRKPTLEEYAALTEAVGWNLDRGTMPGALERSDLGVVAVDVRNATAAGMLRIVGDGRYYTIWDVMVLPSHQGQKIGTRMMEAALDELRKIAKPGTFVGLFTGKPGFYRSLGFHGEGGLHRSL